MSTFILMLANEMLEYFTTLKLYVRQFFKALFCESVELYMPDLSLNNDWVGYLPKLKTLLF